MSTAIDPERLDDPTIRPFLPMLYVAWADGELTDEELASFRARVEDMPWLGAAPRQAMRAWLDPAQPPTAEQLGALLGVIQRDARTLAPARRMHLARLGEALADGDTNVRDALDALMEALQLDPTEAARALFDTAPERADAPVDPAPPPLNPVDLRSVLEPNRVELRNEVRQLLVAPWMRIERDQTKEGARDQVRAAITSLAAAGLGAKAYPDVEGVAGETSDLGDFMVAFETLGLGDLSVLVKFGVQFGLFGGSIYFLGTRAQRERWLPQVASGEMLGCYAMTELGHGSNVMGLETTITYDADRDLLVVHTPDASARKEWIGGAAKDARWATVFGQLRVGEQMHGVLVGHHR